MSTITRVVGYFGSDHDHLLHLRHRRTHQLSVIQPYPSLKISYAISKHVGHNFLSNPGMLRLKIRGEHAKTDAKRDVSTNSAIQPGPSGPSSGENWKSWILGTLLSIFIPFWKCKWLPIMKFRKDVEMVVDTIDAVTEVVEKVADSVEKVADEFAGHLPEGSQLREAVCAVEKIAKHVAEDAHAADEFIHKIEELGEEAEKEEAETLRDKRNEEANEAMEPVKEEQDVEAKEVDKLMEPAMKQENVGAKEVS